MSTLQNNPPVWPIKSPTPVNNTNTNKYEKCLIITEEIYKRINITFEIKKLESGSLSDTNSDSIDSNDLSNETDLFAYDKSSSISSSVSDITELSNNKVINININNNEESKLKKTVPFVKASKPKKRFRKRAKKRLAKSNVSDTDCSSDEQLPLSRIAVDNMAKSGEGSPALNVEKESDIISKEDIKEKIVHNKDDGVCITEPTKKEITEQPPPVLPKQISQSTHPVAVDLTMRIPLVKMEPLDFTMKRNTIIEATNVENVSDVVKIDGKTGLNEGHVCHLCNTTFRGTRGLKRHMTMSHVTVKGLISHN